MGRPAGAGERLLSLYSFALAPHGTVAAHQTPHKEVFPPHRLGASPKARRGTSSTLPALTPHASSCRSQSSAERMIASILSNLGIQPSISRIRSELATRAAGSPGRLASLITGNRLPDTRSTPSITSRTE